MHVGRYTKDETELHVLYWYRLGTLCRAVDYHFLINIIIRFQFQFLILTFKALVASLTTYTCVYLYPNTRSFTSITYYTVHV